MTDIRIPARAAVRRGEVRIVLVDDHAIVRQGLRSVLEREPQLSIVGEASSAPEALAVVAHERPVDRPARPQALDELRLRGPAAVPPAHRRRTRASGSWS